MNRKKSYLCFIAVFLLVSSRAQYPAAVQAALLQTQHNRDELRKALDHFHGRQDSLETKSIDFLVANLPAHNTISYYWADTSHRRINYNELAYATFNDAVIAFNELKTQHGPLHPVPYSFRDIDSISAAFLIETVEESSKAWRSGGNASTGNDSLFLEYVLPYRIDAEALTSWKVLYAAKFKNNFTGDWVADSLQLRRYVKDNFTNLWGIETSKEPLPRLSALQILLRKKGYCEDMADMAVFIARSQGIPAATDNIPAWGTSTGNHTTNYLRFNEQHDHFDAALDSLGREPAKVIRSTFSIQPGTLASWLDTAQIPGGFLRLQNYRDVTNEYWPTANFTVNLFDNTVSKAVYAGVFNGGVIQPVWFAQKKGAIATFKNMGKGVVYFPFYFENHKTIPAGYPCALGYNTQQVLKPDFSKPRRITIKEQEKYLKYRPGKKYQLLIWDKQWVLHSIQTAPEGCKELVFDKVPANALLILAPEYSQGKERPFTILDNGSRQWW